MNPALLLAGATGLIGADVLDRLLADDSDRLIIVPTRRALGCKHPRLREIVVDLSDATQDANLQRAISVAVAPGGIGGYLSCLGTTIRAAGSRAAFEAVDYALVLRLARIARALGASQATLISSVGADARSANFYLAVKGRIEQALVELGFERVDLLRPGLLRGQRTQHRPGEALGQSLLPLLDGLLLGPLRRYRTIAASEVAAAAVALQGASGAGPHIHEYAQLHSAR